MSCDINYLDRKVLTEQEAIGIANLHSNTVKELVDNKLIKQTSASPPTYKVVDEEEFKKKDDELTKRFGTKIIRNLGDNIVKIDFSNVAYASYTESKTNTNVTKLAKESKQKLSNTKEVVYAINQRLSNALNQLSKTTVDEKVKFKEKIKVLQKDLDLLSQESNTQAIMEYISSALQFTNDYVNDYLEPLNDDINKGKNVSIAPGVLATIDDHLQLYTLLEDIKKSVSNKTFKDEFKSEHVEFKELEEYLNTALNSISKVNELRLNIGRYHISNMLAPYSNKALIIARQNAEIKFKKTYPIRKGESLKDYNKKINDLVNYQINQDYAIIQEQEKRMIYDKLVASPFDISGFGAWVSSEKDLNSTVIGLASVLLDEADLMRDRKIIDYRLEAFNVYKDFEKETTGQTAQEKYKGLYQEGSDGKLYIAGEYDVEWYIQNKKLQIEYFDVLSKNDPNSEEVKLIEDKRTKWLAANSKTESISENNKLTTHVIPTDKWKNKEYFSTIKTEGKKKMSDFLRKSSVENDKNLHGNLSLIRTALESRVQFIEAPRMGKSTFEKIDKNLVNNIQDSITSIYQTKADATEYGSLEKDPSKGIMTALTNISGETKSGVPIHFRMSMPIKDISFDLLSSITVDTFMAENYKHKTALTAELELLKDIVAEKTFDKTYGTMKQKLMMGLDSSQEVAPLKGTQSNEYKVLSSILENRLYGKETIKAEGAELMNSIMKWTASSMLMINLPSGMVNTFQGQIYNFIEAVGGQHFDRNNLLNAQKTYFNDLGDNLNDIGKAIPSSTSNMMMDLFNIQGTMKSLSNKFIEDNRVKALMKSGTAYAASHLGEHYMHGVLMYAILDNIKVLNKDGEFIDSNGVVTTKEKALTLRTAFSKDSKTGKLVLNKHAAKTSYGKHSISLNNLKNNKSILEIKQLINKVAHDLHGNYNPAIQSMAQRYVFLKLVFMLRKWVVSGFNTRWQGTAATVKRIKDFDTIDQLSERDESDVVYSESTQSLKEGYYTTAIRFFSNYMKEVKNNLDLLSLYGLKTGFSQLTTTEQANMRKFVAEMAFIVLSYMLSNLLFKLAEELPDDSASREALFYATYTVRRMYSETSSFLNVTEAWKIANSPAASLSYIRKLSALAGQIATDTGSVLSGEDLERYDRTRRSGELKLQKRTFDVLPVLSQFSTNVEEKTGWIFGIN